MFGISECERQLIDQPRRALRPLPVDLTLQLGDPQFLRGDQRHVFRRLRANDRQFRFQRGVFFRKSGAGGVHDAE